MATRLPVGPFRDQTFRAAAALTAYQYCLVKLASATTVTFCGAGEKPVGILQNAPADGGQAIVRTFGESYCSVDATVAIVYDYGCLSAAAGVGVKNTTDKGPIVGWFRESLASGTGTIVVDVQVQTMSV